MTLEIHDLHTHFITRGGTLRARNTEPPITLSAPTTVAPPSTVAFAYSVAPLSTVGWRLRPRMI